MDKSPIRRSGSDLQELIAAGQGRSAVGGFFLSLIGALLLALAVFLLLPLSQILTGEPSPRMEVRSITPLPQPPPPPPPPPSPEQSDEQPTVTAVEPLVEPTRPPSPELQSLNLRLDTGIGDAAAGLLSWGEFAPAIDTQADLDAFPIEELDSPPKRLNNPPVNYPRQLRRDNITGVVRLLVLLDEQGNVSVLNVISSDHPDFIPAAREAAELFRFEPPMRRGRVVRARFILPIRFQLR